VIYGTRRSAAGPRRAAAHVDAGTWRVVGGMDVGAPARRGGGDSVRRRPGGRTARVTRAILDAAVEEVAAVGYDAWSTARYVIFPLNWSDVLVAHLH